MEVNGRCEKVPLIAGGWHCMDLKEPAHNARCLYRVRRVTISVAFGINSPISFFLQLLGMGIGQGSLRLAH